MQTAFILLLVASIASGNLLAEEQAPYDHSPWTARREEHPGLLEIKQIIRGGSEASAFVQLSKMLDDKRAPGGVPQSREWFQLSAGLKQLLRDDRELRKKFDQRMSLEAEVFLRTTLENASEADMEKLLSVFPSTSLAQRAAIQLAKMHVEENPIRSAHYYDELVAMVGYPDDISTNDLYAQAFTYAQVNDLLGAKEVLKILEARGKPAFLNGSVRYGFDEFTRALEKSLADQQVQKSVPAEFVITTEEDVKFRLCDDGKILIQDNQHNFAWYEHGKLLARQPFPLGEQEADEGLVHLTAACEVIVALPSGDILRMSQENPEIWRSEPLPLSLLSEWQQYQKIEIIDSQYIVLKLGIGGKLLFLSYATGKRLWSAFVEESPSLIEVFACGNGDVAVETGTELHFFDSMGELLRRVVKLHHNAGKVAGSEDIFFVYKDSHYAAYRKGKQIWKMANSFFGSPTKLAASASGKHLYSFDGKMVTIIDGQNGEILTQSVLQNHPLHVVPYGKDGVIMVLPSKQGQLFWNGKFEKELSFFAHKDEELFDYDMRVTVSDQGVLSAVGTVKTSPGLVMTQRFASEVDNSVFYTGISPKPFLHYGRFRITPTKELLKPISEHRVFEPFFPSERVPFQILD